MAFGDHAYTRLVRGLKVALPLIALVLISTMFMLSRKIDPTTATALVDRAFRERIEQSQLSKPQYAGNTKSGKNLTVTAKSARPDPDIEGKAYGQEVNALITLESGEVMTVTANTGIIDEAADLAVLSGDVHIVTTDGYDIRTGQLSSVLSRVEGESAGPIDGFGPPGTLSAGKMYVKTVDETGKLLLIFTQGVHLVYTNTDKD